MIDDEVHVIYYVTKKGYDFFSKYLDKCIAYRPVPQKRKAITALHDMGVSAVYSSFLQSPFKFTPYFEYTTAYRKAAMPEGKQYRNAVRTDLIISYGSRYSLGYIYNEHDTGTESIIRILNKIDLYASHNMMKKPNCIESGRWDSDMILYSFRRKYAQRPVCFQIKEVKRLIEHMREGTVINSLRKTEMGAVIRSLKNGHRRWQNAGLKKYWSNIYLNWKEGLTHIIMIIC